MKTNLNYRTKFREGEEVQITEGFHRGKKGVIVNYSPNVQQGYAWDSDRPLPKHGVYDVRLSWWRTITAFECDLKSLSGWVKVETEITPGRHFGPFGIQIVSDPSVPDGEAHLRDETGKVVGKIINIEKTRSGDEIYTSEINDPELVEKILGAQGFSISCKYDLEKGKFK